MIQLLYALHSIFPWTTYRISVVSVKCELLTAWPAGLWSRLPAAVCAAAVCTTAEVGRYFNEASSSVSNRNPILVTPCASKREIQNTLRHHSTTKKIHFAPQQICESPAHFFPSQLFPVGTHRYVPPIAWLSGTMAENNMPRKKVGHQQYPKHANVDVFGELVANGEHLSTHEAGFK